MESIKTSLAALANAALASHQKSNYMDLNKSSVIEALKTYFNVGTEKNKISFSYKGSFPLDYSPLINLPKTSMVKTAERVTQAERVMLSFSCATTKLMRAINLH